MGSFVTSVAGLLITALILLVSWRVWRFTIRPRLYPNDPKELPYWIPFVGHAAGFFVNFKDAVGKGTKHFGPSREPFAMTVAGQTIYIATSPHDFASIWKNSNAFSMTPLSKEMYGRVGLSEKSVESMFDPHPEARYNEKNQRPMNPTQMVTELHYQQLHNGPNLDALVEKKLIPGLFQRLDFSKPGHPALTSHSESSIVVSLLDLCVDLFITEESTAYFGPKLLEQSPDLPKSFMTWEYVNWKFIYMLPEFLAQDMVDSKAYITGAFTKYFKLPRSERPDAIPFVLGLEDMLRDAGLTDDELGQFTLLHYWAVVGNVYKFAFWLTAHLARNPSLLAEIRQEVAPAVRNNSIDEKYLLEQCPKLDSLSLEILRLTVTSPHARVVVEPTVLGGKLLKPGNKIMMGIQELHYDTEIWGSTPGHLDAERFVQNPKLGKNSSYKPWGGGHSLCPGRFLARRIGNAYMAILLNSYDIAIESNGFPQGDGTRPSPGVLCVGRDEDVLLRLTPRK